MYKFNKKKVFMEKSQSDKRQKRFDDSAQENLKPQDQKKKFRNALLDSMFNSGIVKYAALLKDESEHNLFCGQVGEVQDVTIATAKNPEKDCCFLTFIDFDNNGHDITNCVVKKENLLPLFSFDPTEDETITTIFKDRLVESIWTMKKIRDEWDEHEVHYISKEKLKKHTRSETRFEIGQLVTVEVDFKQTLRNPNNEVFIIQAGQTGIISKTHALDTTLDTDCVEVTFWSMPFGSLASERKELVSKSLPQNLANVASSSNTDSLEDSLDIESLVDSSWTKTIRIHKDHVFPLYCETLYAI